MKFIKIILVFITFYSYGNPLINPPADQIHWMSFEKAIELNKTNPKPILIDVYTEWCGWCHKMDANTYSEKIIVNYINTYFYAVKLDAEQKESIFYNDHTFKFIPNGSSGTHELASALLNGNLSYPSTVFLNKNQELIQVVPGYLKTPIMEKLLHYMGEEIYLTKDWEEFDKEFNSKT
ncbi:MAG: DUF255 domain-containing protein [Wenyingzhuangia sp.]|jgi:thioredoxin-related protein|uniref:thioredoxin family protein n=1 Tax=Wenyingzhuangia sp. TaxID=1964193 RepID=UPI00321A23E8